MKDQITPKDYWAEEKVRTFAPSTKEKATFVAIARYADPDGWGSIVSYDRVARDTGQGRSTVRRHVKALVERGDLVTLCDLRRRSSSNSFFIPLVAESIEALEVIYKVSRKQLRLPLVQRDRAGGMLPETVVERATPRLNLSHPQARFEPVPITDQPINKDSGSFILKTKKDKHMERAEKALENGPIALETQRLIDEAMQNMIATPNQPTGLGSRLRDSIWGGLTDAEINEQRKEALGVGK